MGKKWAVLLCLLLMAASLAAAEEDVSLSDVPQRPALYLISPSPGSSYESGGRLTVRVEGVNIARYQVELEVEGQTYRQESQSETFEHVFVFDQPPCEAAVIRVTGQSPEGLRLPAGFHRPRKS